MYNLENSQSDLFSSDAKINYESLSGLVLNETNCQSISIMNTLIKGGSFNHVNLAYSDVFGTKIIDFKIEDTTFENADINSIWASNCTFINVNFSGSTFTDSTFVNCFFTKCTFSHIALSSNQFERCTFYGFHLLEGTTTLNNFFKCDFNDAEFIESVYYQIFEECIFTDTRFERKLLGYNYGFSDQQIELLFGWVSSEELRETFIGSKLFINAAVLTINLDRGLLDSAVVACIAVVVKMLSKDYLVKADELQFIAKLFNYFIDRHLVAPISYVLCWNEIQRLQSVNKNAAIIKSAETMNSLKNSIYFNYQNFLFELQKNISQCVDPEAPILIRMHYGQKPSHSLCPVLQEIITVNKLSLPVPTIVKTEKGSFIEIIETYGSIVPFLQTFVSLLGIATPIIVSGLKERKKEKDKKRKKENQSKNSSIDDSSTALAELIQSSLAPYNSAISKSTEQIASSVVTVTVEMKLSVSNDFNGFNSDNVQDIQVQCTS